jgi:hypothetical protein
MKRSGQSAGRLSNAGKWLTAMITTGAALAALLVNARNLGMSQMLGVAEYSARRIWITPRADTLAALGDTTALAATVTDKSGVALGGLTLRWQSSDTSVATVDSAGTVVAQGSGTAHVTVSVRDVKADAAITVRQVPTGIEIPGDTVVRLLEGDTVPFVAYALDARRHRIQQAMPRWHSADSAIVAVDSLGRAVATAPGWTTLSAGIGDREARIVARVDVAPAVIMLISGTGQRAPTGHVVPQQIAVRVLSRGGMPVPGVAVAFTPADGEGSVEPATVIADRDGRARAAWTLGPRPGRQTLVTSVPLLDSTLRIVAEADPIAGNTRVAVLSAALAGRVTEMLAETVAVRVADTTGAALPDVPIAWAVVDGGRIEPLDSRSDSVGEARARWILGGRAGRQRLRIQVGNPRTIPPVTVTASATAGDPAAIAVLSGDAQSGPVGAALGKPVVVVVRDAQGNGVPTAALTVHAAQGSVADTTPQTDSAGRAVVRWTLGRKPGTQQLTVRLPGLDSTRSAITARARPGPPANVTFSSAPAKAKAGVPVRLIATVTDDYGNPVSNALVVFTTRAGGLSVSRVRTDNAGNATTRWTPARTPTDQQFTATLGGTAIKSTHSARVSLPAATR